MFESLPKEGRAGEEAKPGMEMESSKLDELIGETAMEVVERIKKKKKKKGRRKGKMERFKG